jgi:predicted nucleic acid-binding protein
MIPCTAGIPERFAKVIVERDRAGRPILRDDAWIAATALHHDLPLVTHDTNFLGTEGLRVISANPEVISLQTASGGYRPLHMELQCRCGY